MCGESICEVNIALTCIQNYFSSSIYVLYKNHDIGNCLIMNKLNKTQTAQQERSDKLRKMRSKKCSKNSFPVKIFEISF